MACPMPEDKLNQRLNIKNKTTTLLDFEDISLIIKEIIRLNNNTESEPDDIDHLGIGALERLENYFKAD